jgi:pimeloyl-ACP methyl ester carboxylesterase
MPLADGGIYYETWGEAAAPPLLLIMGFSVSSRGWEHLPDLLSARFRVLTFDNRGTGRSARTGFLYRMRDLAADATAVLDHAGIARADVFGVSMGGMIALELALRHPERVRRLALGATYAGWRRSAKPRLRSQLDLLLIALRASLTPARVSRLLSSPQFEEAHPGRTLQWLRGAEAARLRFALAQGAAILRHSANARLSQIRASTLVITGDADRLVPPRNSEVLARSIPGAKLLVLPGAGHVFPLEREQETARALTEHFLG